MRRIQVFLKSSLLRWQCLFTAPTTMMTYFQDSHIDATEFYSTSARSSVKRERGPEIHLLKEKLVTPRFRGLLSRPRLEDLLRKSCEQFPATLVSGRAGTGKTALAAEFARRQDHVAWYSVESSDAEWNVFAMYFAACVLKAVKSKADVRDLLPEQMDGSQSSIATFLINVFAEAETELLHEPLLIVLDGIHHVFDADWFGEFFALLLSSLPDKVNLLLLCRSKPPNPLWRLRSKQQLNVVDEKVLAFDLAETADLFRKRGLKRADAERAHAATFGRISKLVELARK